MVGEEMHCVDACLLLDLEMHRERLWWESRSSSWGDWGWSERNNEDQLLYHLDQASLVVHSSKRDS